MSESVTLHKVLVSDELFRQLGADTVEWGDPDDDGFYTPSVYLDDAVLGRRLHAAVHPGHDGGCEDVIRKMVSRYRDAE